MDKYLLNKKVDLWLTIVLTMGLAVIIFPILIWLIYRLRKAKKVVTALKEELKTNPEKFNELDAEFGFGISQDGDMKSNSVEINITGDYYDIPQLYMWFSKYKSKERLATILNGK